MRYQQRNENNNFREKISENGQVSIPLNCRRYILERNEFATEASQPVAAISCSEWGGGGGESCNIRAKPLDFPAGNIINT